MSKYKPQFTISQNPFDEEKYGERLIHHLPPVMIIKVNMADELEKTKLPYWEFDYMHPLHVNNLQGSEALIKKLAGWGFESKNSLQWLASKIGLEAMAEFQQVETVQFVLEFAEKYPDETISKKINQAKHWYITYLTEIDLETLAEQVEVWIGEELDSRQDEIRMN